MNKDPRCQRCRYNTPKTKGGKGRLCNGLTMTKYSRCPEWVINEYLRDVKPRTLVMSKVVSYNKVKEVIR